MRIGIIGAGAVGGYFGGKLALAGKDVRVVARGETLQKIRSAGLQLIEPEGESTTVEVPVAESFAELGGVDVVILATKALPGQDTFPGIPAAVPVVTTQNSVEVPYLAAELLGESRVWPGVVRGFMVHRGPGVVEFKGGPLSLNFGTFDTSPSELAQQLAADLTEAGLVGSVHEDIWVDVWNKAIFTAPMGALGAASTQPLGYLRTVLRPQLQQLFAEADQVARAMGVNLPMDQVAQTLAFADSLPEAATSSMQRDFLAGQISELDAQVGAIRRLGDHVKVETPLHDMLQAVLEAQAAAAGRE
ncbi:2-dehydropantoate 2-reductase [Corynebacterium occultum]|uniref:2-dehydropantoate 2-reductase n=1 Tax=Corynebacterium occultum TaxID=2675219 RepID=A0A6B8W9C2_9CORY|nr:2-dehydropantoate 2-reductase [Corynebacterium occultum]QGU07865.1 2-dehydropantoate 2-reductase [Corynebacterium occultum]